jgi:DNA-binding transcriptional ArsR family regulator
LPAASRRFVAFREGLFRGEVVDSLSREEAIAAVTRPLHQTERTMDDEVAEAVVAEVEGYPYFIQLWGSELWDAAELAGVDRITPALLDEARPEIQARLDRDFYEPRISTLTPAEQDLLLASAAYPYPPLRASDLAEASDKTPGNVNVLLGRLIEAGALYRIRKGEYAYTAPRFRDFLLRRAAA